MLSKCANAVCTTPFRRLSEGKLFLLQAEQKPTQEPSDPKDGKPPRRLEYFWLCSTCAGLVTLTFNSKTGVTTVPLAGVALPPPIREGARPGGSVHTDSGMLAHAAGYHRG